jgi:hypothetical protein
MNFDVGDFHVVPRKIALRILDRRRKVLNLEIFFDSEDSGSPHEPKANRWSLMRNGNETEVLYRARGPWKSEA